MRNRGKCKLCKDVLESFHEFDRVECSCGEVSITGGQVKFLVFAKDFANFLRIDDQDKEISVKIREKDEMELLECGASIDSDSGDNNNGNVDLDGKGIGEDLRPAFTRDELVATVDHLISYIDGLDSHRQLQPVSQIDLKGILSLIRDVLQCKDA